MIRISMAAAAVLAMTGAAASAQEAQDTQEAQEAQEEASNKRICRSSKMTGSLTRRTRICMTETEWRELANRTRKGLEEMGQAASGGTAVANNQGANGN